jgi:U3 small nucleolar RNA-associated protein 14
MSDEEIEDSSSEVGWESEDDLFFSSNREDDLSNDDDGEQTGDEGIFLSDFRPQKSTVSHVVDHSEEGADRAHDESGHGKLLKAIHRFSQSDGNAQETKKLCEKPSKISHVSMELLLGALDDNQSPSSSERKTLATIESADLSTPAPPVGMISKKMERQRVYDESKLNINKWNSSVLNNRHSKSLNFSNDKRKMTGSRSLVHLFVPETRLERDINMVISANDGLDGNLQKCEGDSLRGQGLSIDEVKAKQKEIAKFNSLLFFDQMKRHRMNKIKSKAYRKSLRRRISQQGVNEDERITENAHLQDRIEERASLSHRNTSRWSKMVISQKKIDKSLSSSYYDSVQLGHELMQKISERTSENAEVLHRDQSEFSQSEYTGRYNKLLQMDFMKKAVERNILKAKELDLVLSSETDASFMEARYPNTTTMENIPTVPDKFSNSAPHFTHRDPSGSYDGNAVENSVVDVRTVEAPTCFGNITRQSSKDPFRNLAESSSLSFRCSLADSTQVSLCLLVDVVLFIFYFHRKNWCS